LEDIKVINFSHRGFPQTPAYAFRERHEAPPNGFSLRGSEFFRIIDLREKVRVYLPQIQNDSGCYHGSSPRAPAHLIYPTDQALGGILEFQRGF
jgi:hypothetical protein